MPRTTATAQPTTTTTTTAAQNITTTAAPNTTTTAAPNTTTTAAPNTTTTAAPNTTTTAAPNTTTTAAPNTTTTAAPNTTTTAAPTTTTTAAPNTTTTAAPTTTTTTAALPNVTITVPNNNTSTTTTSTTTTAVITTTATTKPSTTTQLLSENFTVTLDVSFDSSFNSPESKMYQDTHKLISDGCQKSLENCVVSSLNFKAGSTIVESIISAPSFPKDTLVVEQAIISEMTKAFKVITDGDPLDFLNKPVLFGKRATLACDPTKSGLNFSSFSATWFKDNGEITPSQESHTVSNTGGRSLLTIKTFYRRDTGRYECRLTDGNNIFRQKSENELTFGELPIVHLNRTSQTKMCTGKSSEVIECSVQRTVQHIYKVRWKGQTSALGKAITVSDTNCPGSFTGTCEVEGLEEFNKKITLNFVSTTSEFACESEKFGLGKEGEQAEEPCEGGKVGVVVFTCLKGKWTEEEEDNCVLGKIQELVNLSQDLIDPDQVPEILDELNEITNELQRNVTESSATIEAIVSVMESLANISKKIAEEQMKDILNTSSILTSEEAKTSWDKLNFKTYNIKSKVKRSTVKRLAASSRFLNNLEMYADKFENTSGNIATELILFNKTLFSDTFQEEYSGSVQIEIPESGLQNNEITVLTFESLHNVLPAIDQKNSSNLSINAKVVLVQSRGVDNVTFTFDLRNDSLFSPQCVFWNFSLFNTSGGWDDEGCTLVNATDSEVICQCNHLTSFSVLMSPNAHFSEHLQRALDIITYIGVSISIVSLVICLIIEAVVWKKIRRPRVSYMRHVTIVNIAVSLLCADIWFLIGAGISTTKDKPSCTAATFFIHFFYLALFFWMLVSGLLLFYRTISVFDSGVRKRTMLAIGFSIGYGAPIIIAVVTIAATAGQKHYIQINNVCWLNWNDSHALLAFVIPALTIVAINFLILCVVIYKIIRRRASTNGANAEEKHVMVVIFRCLAFLTPFFGLTWCLGVATMIDIEDDNSKFGVHVSFAFFNSLQGFFVLLFGTLLDKKVRQEMTLKSTSSGATRSTSAGPSSSSNVPNFLQNRMRRRRDGYNISSNADESAVTNT